MVNYISRSRILPKYKEVYPKRINLLLEQFPIVAIIGARQVGKTTLAKQLRPKWHYVDLEVPNTRDMILLDPELFFKNYPQAVILDEAQSSPILFKVLRGVIDENRQLLLLIAIIQKA